MYEKIFAKLDYSALLKSPRKGKRRQIQIAEAAIEILYRQGLIDFSYDHLAKRCGLARAGIYSYFPTLTDLLLFSCGLIRFKYQEMVLEKVAKAKSPHERLLAYSEAAISWVEVAPKHASVWLLFFHQCNVNEAVARHHQQWVDMGTKRIATILAEGIKSGCFSLGKRECDAAARMIQLVLTGALASRATEARDQKSWLKEKRLVLSEVIRLAKAK